MELAPNLLALTRLEIAVVQVGSRLQAPLTAQQRKEALLQDIVRDLGSVDAFFSHKDTGLLAVIARSEKAGTSLTTLQDENYRVAVSRSRPFCRLLTAMLLAD